jgi:hypothetical protein
MGGGTALPDRSSGTASLPDNPLTLTQSFRRDNKIVAGAVDARDTVITAAILEPDYLPDVLHPIRVRTFFMANSRFGSGAATLGLHARDERIGSSDGPAALVRGLSVGLPVSLFIWVSLAVLIF